MRLAALLLLLATAPPATAGTVVAARTIRATEIFGPGDVSLAEGDTPGAASEVSMVLGQEARVMLYAGRPVRLDQIGPPALVERNQMVSLIYAAGGLRIVTEARVLDRAAEGEAVRVMNLASRKTVMGIVQPDGSVTVGSEGR
jgi:flagellar basal body P-ring formation protein FlgA